MRNLLSAFILCFSLCLSPFLQAQTEVNVMVRRSENNLVHWLQKQRGKRSFSFPAQYSQRALAFNSLSKIEPLHVPQPGKVLEDADRLFSFHFSNGNLKARIKQLEGTGLFEFVEENRSVQLHAATAAAPNDPGIADSWFHPLIETFAAWDSSKGDPSVWVGVLDTGLDYEHPEFEGQLAVNAVEDINGNGTFEAWADTVVKNGISGDLDNIDNDGNGFADDVIGYDFTDQPRSPFGGDYLFPDADPLDDNDHGTLVAGILAAKEDNNYGGAGVAPGIKLKVLRCFAASGGGEDDDISRAIVYAADNNIPILNFSFGDIYPSRMMHEAIKYAYARGVVMVASAGNGTGDELHYPSNFDEVISVSASALDFDGTNEILWPLSSYGLTVSLAAPGSGIFAPVVRDSSGDEPFGSFSGTSTSAPMVAGAVALLFSQRGTCSPQQVRGILTGSADDISQPGWDHFTGAGRLNILKALQSPGASNVQILSPGNDSGEFRDSVWVIGTVFEPQMLNWSLEYREGTGNSGAWTSVVSGQNQQVRDDTLGNWEIAALTDGEYTLRLKVEKSNGSTAEDRIRFVIDRTPPLVQLNVNEPIWDNFERKQFLVFRSSDRGLSRLHFRPVGSTNYASLSFDRSTRNGDFLLGSDELAPGDYEFYISTRNLSGLSGQSVLDTFTFVPGFVNLYGYDTLSYSLPMGQYLPGSYDLDGDGLEEVFMSRYNDNLGFGQLMLYEYNGGMFSPSDSLDFKPVLLPKDVSDVDGDGLLELLCSVNDSLFVYEQPQANSFTSERVYSNLGNSFYAARWGDADGDNQAELITKDFENYQVHEFNGGTYSLEATLVDNSPDYTGSVAPRALVGDFDGDGQAEVVYGDFDGDFLVFENQGGSYVNTFTDTTDLTKSGSYLCQGDFDNDGQEEIFVATHTSLNRNEEDFEYFSPYWKLRIFKSNADNSYEMVWEEHLYDIDTEGFNAATAGDLDTEPGDEIIFSSFPRTWIIDFQNGAYETVWFHYGALCTHHTLGDFNGNGVNEFALGRGDKALFWEYEFNYTGPYPSSALRGKVEGPDSIELSWEPAPNANEYRIWRGEVTSGGSVLISLIDSVNASNYADNNLTAEQRYLYVIQSKNSSLTPSISDFSNPVVLTPHAPFRVDSLEVLGQNQLKLIFSRQVREESGDKSRFVVNGVNPAEALIASGPDQKGLVLSFTEAFVEGQNELRIDSTYRDLELGKIAASSQLLPFLFSSDTSQFAYLTRWEALNDKEAGLWFNFEMDASVLDIANYQILPTGRITDVSWGDSEHRSVKISVDPVAFGPKGYSLSVIISGVTALNGASITEKEGNIATFSAFASDLSMVYVYPNPYQPHGQFEGVRFANLSREASVSVFTASGLKVIDLEENDGDGGLEWDLRDLYGERIRPGVYLYRVTNQEGEEFLGQFVVGGE